MTFVSAASLSNSCLVRFYPTPIKAICFRMKCQTRPSATVNCITEERLACLTIFRIIKPKPDPGFDLLLFDFHQCRDHYSPVPISAWIANKFQKPTHYYEWIINSSRPRIRRNVLKFSSERNFEALCERLSVSRFRPYCKLTAKIIWYLLLPVIVSIGKRTEQNRAGERERRDSPLTVQLPHEKAKSTDKARTLFPWNIAHY